MDLSNENVIHIQKNGIEYLQFRRLLEYKDVINHAYSLGKGVNFRTNNSPKFHLSKEQFDSNCKDYDNLCNCIGENSINIVKCNQEHTKNIKTVQQKINENKPDFDMVEYDYTDGLITNKSNLILATTNADCILFLLFDPVKKVVANVHSGWKGTLQRISVEAVKKMIEEYDCNPGDIICCICPSIRKCHFEVDQEVKDLFEKEFNEVQDFIEFNKTKNKWYIDTVLINKIILKNIGLRDENIIDSGICSVCNSDIIHSFRVEKEGYGLSTALINLK